LPRWAMGVWFMQITMEKRSHDETDILRLLVAGTASETGSDFFRALVRNLAAALGTVGAWVTEYIPQERKLRALAMWLKDGFVADYEYKIDGTACERVVESRTMVHIPERLIELFPRDVDLVPIRAVSYLGAPLLDVDGSVIGHLSVLDDKPMPHDARMISLFQIFAGRATAEHRRLRIEEEIRGREEQLSALLDTAMDAILVLDAKLTIVRINEAAARVFECTTEDMAGESLCDFLVKDSAAHVSTFASSLGSQPRGKQQLWVPQNFMARRWNHSVFPAEATLSRFENRGRTYFTLILRNIYERVEAEKKIQLLMQETEYLRESIGALPGRGDLLGRSDCMTRVFEAIEQVGRTDTTVLITGETGTGKELVARSIHKSSSRAHHPLILVNCAAVPANLMESEFFGHERGAFTGAVNRREGRFSLANGGTIFLDEIGELPLELQPKLLRVLQEGEFEPLGSSKTVKVSVRVIAATHRDLRRMVTDGKFREDLYFRLNVFPISIPPLRARGKQISPLTATQVSQLRAYDWPGNVRELQNVIERSMILTDCGELRLDRAMAGFASSETPHSESPAHNTLQDQSVMTATQLEDFERKNIIRALERCRGKISGPAGAARLIGVPASTLSSRMKALKIPKSEVQGNESTASLQG
jgi:formate hydrogenlyase transcriptional activator